MNEKKKQKYAKAGERLSDRAIKKLSRLNPRLFGNLLSAALADEAPMVKPKSDAQQGQWVCADCGEVFQNNLEASGHNRNHRMAWWTGEQFEEA